MLTLTLIRWDIKIIKRIIAMDYWNRRNNDEKISWSKFI
jgi:hypothetical protein